MPLPPRLETCLNWLKKLKSLILERMSYWDQRLQKKAGRLVSRLLVYPFLAFLLLIGGSFSWYFYWDRSDMPDIEFFINGAPTVGEIYDSNGEVVVQLAKEYRRIIPFEQYPPHVVNAILAAEDTRFFKNLWILNKGVDWIAVGRAVVVNGSYTILTSYRKGWTFDFVSAEGASTITQQTVRLYFLTEITKKENENQLINDNFLTRAMAGIFEVKEVNKIIRKLIEIKYSIWLVNEMADRFGSMAEGKRQIFIRFTPYLGNGRYGFDTASEFYFGKYVWELSPDEIEKAALLAGMIKNPSVYTPRLNTTLEREEIQLSRRNKILSRMAADKYIKKSDAEKFKKRPIEIVARSNIKTIAPSAVNETLNEIEAKGFDNYDLITGSIQVKSTLNLRIQEIANQACENGVKKYEDRHPQYKGQVQCSAVVLRNHDAAILAEVGGRKFYQNRNLQYYDLNRVNRARQAGSAFKPLIYVTAFRNGWTPDRIILDAPVGIPMGYGRGDHYINNYDGRFLGPIPACEALYKSRNAPAVRLTMGLGQGYFEESGMKKVIDTARLLGIKSSFHSDVDHKKRTVYYPTSALGASEMTVMELANAYREIASGISAEPHVIQQMISRQGEIIFEEKNNHPPSEIESDTLDMVRSCLRKVVTQPGGTAYSLTAEKFPVPVAGKTGTTNDFRNALFIGWTHNGITVGVRLDFDDNRKLGSGETGAKGPLPIFKEIVKNIYAEKLIGPITPFPAHIEKYDYRKKTSK